ncbi:MAG: hypothetical protein AVDCRST_MAG31-1488 [uncultured Sphingomonas sp.]|uniref:Lipoprotein n=1 Tax=uncultured Sphingomonas sp. TaxID=158754 RepID=A0A6J4TCC3_9SPHN|nr:hypothetical protein [uncultured Sphingomonas sp.]CAA9519471.1 MAG: hypothetical protein AVDCRST_MAG31-1488 [uncultured Sphingomonas sp.]
MRRLLPALAALGLAACATPSDRIADALVGYGIAPAQAQCVGARLEQRLSIGQLRELGRLARAYRENDPNPGALTVTDLVRVTSQVNDPRVPVEVGRAAAGCGLIGAGPLGMLNALTRS